MVLQSHWMRFQHSRIAHALTVALALLMVAALTFGLVLNQLRGSIG
jgi:hypothetical protein